MSKCHSMVVLIVGAILAGVLVLSLNSPTAMAGGVVSGRKANSVESFYLQPTPGNPATIPSVPGRRGFIITDIYITGGTNTLMTVTEGETIIARVARPGVHFEAGIRVDAGSKLSFDTDSTTFVHVSGYTF